AGGGGVELSGRLDREPDVVDQVHYVDILETMGGSEEELKRWVAWGPRVHRSVTWIGMVADLENRRLFAAALKDDEDRATRAAILARHRAALLRRDIVVPVALLEALALEKR